jgi:hypothetical protein
MVSLKRIVGVILLLLAGYFVMSCDDFFSPTTEIFNKLENPTTINQEQKQKKENNSTDTIVISGQEYMVN